MQDINYDDVLVDQVITITLGGKRYQVKEPSIGEILAFNKEREKMHNVPNIEVACEQIKKLIRTVYTNIPANAFDGFSPKKLYCILADVAKFIEESMLPEPAEEEPKKKIRTSTK